MVSKESITGEAMDIGHRVLRMRKEDESLSPLKAYIGNGNWHTYRIVEKETPSRKKERKQNVFERESWGRE